MIYSFDIFDTCLIRKCGQPHFIFDLLAGHVLCEDVEETQILDFKQIRIKSELQARGNVYKSNREEITLDEIYSICDFSTLTTVDNETIKAIELQIEREQLVAVLAMRDCIRELRENGNDIMFISDMYLPLGFVKNILTEQGLYEEGDKLFISSECGLTKGSGNLFKYIREKEELDVHSWQHTGDNNWSDIKVPKSLGIKVKQIADGYSYYEKIWNQLVPIDNRYTNQLCASISRYIRLTSKEAPTISIAADFIAPMYVSFVAWLMDDARDRGIRHLYFVARDGQIFYEISKELKDTFPDIETSYLYASRKSLYLPGLSIVRVEDLERLVMGRKLQNVLDCFQLEDYFENFEKYNNLSGRALFDALLADEQFVTILSRKQLEKREIALKYFKQEGLHRDHSAIVDLNGRRNCHKSICGILQSDGLPEPFGYFLSVSEDRITGKDYKAMFLFDSDSAYRLRFVRSLPPIMISEEYFNMANHPTTVSYKEEWGGQVVPVFGKETSEASTRKEIFNTNVDVCRRYAKVYKNCIDIKASAGICHRSLYIVSDFVFAPSYSLLSPFHGLTYDYTTFLKAKMIREGSLFSLIKNRKRSGWFCGEFVDRFPLHDIATFTLRLILHLRRIMVFR